MRSIAVNMKSISSFQQVSPISGQKPLSISRTGYWLFLVFVLYLVIPVIDIPLLGLSLSAPILFLVFLEVFLGAHGLRADRYSVWLVVAYAFLFGLLLSLTANAVFHNQAVVARDILTLVRFSYWILVFLTTLVLVASIDTLKTIGFVIVGGTLTIAGLRLCEAILFGRWGAWTAPQIMAQNFYGIQFSSFFPFMLALPFVLHRRRRLAVIGLLLTITAVAGNGSRSSWIAIAIGTAVFMLLYATTQHKGMLQVQRWIVLVLGLLSLCIALAPREVLDPINERLNTFSAIEKDKSYAIRELMVQKGLHLFQDAPLYGVGIGRFTQTVVPLDIPVVLSYASQSHFDYRSSHNSYIALLGETGLSGIAPFVILHLLLFTRGFRAAISLAKDKNIWAIAIFAGYVGMSIHLWSMAALTGTGPWFVYGLVAGIIERNGRFSKEIKP